MYPDLYDYPLYSDVLLDIFETKINFNLRCCHFQSKSSKSYKKTTWIKKNAWDMFETTLPEALKLIKSLKNKRMQIISNYEL